MLLNIDYHLFDVLECIGWRWVSIVVVGLSVRHNESSTIFKKNFLSRILTDRSVQEEGTTMKIERCYTFATQNYRTLKSKDM